MRLAAAFSALLAFAQEKQIAITIDDLPIAGSVVSGCAAERMLDITKRLLEPLQRAKAPFTGFVNEGACRLSDEALRRVLAMWLEAGGDLGNHTYSHFDLHKVTLAEFTADVERGARVTRGLLKEGGRELRYFRHPFLHTGDTEAKKKGLANYLEQNSYVAAPVTVDNSDYMFAAIYSRAVERGDSATADRVIREYTPYMESVLAFFEQRGEEVTGGPMPHILLLHANDLNAAALPELLAMLKSRAYRIVSLTEALRHKAYGLPEEYVGPGGFSWMHRWSMTKGVKNKGEPDEPAWIREEFSRLQRR